MNVVKYIFIEEYRKEIRKRKYEDLLELENTEYDWGHNVPHERDKYVTH